jgi:hypothetical protein
MLELSKSTPAPGSWARSGGEGGDIRASPLIDRHEREATSTGGRVPRGVGPLSYRLLTIYLTIRSRFSVRLEYCLSQTSVKRARTSLATSA